MLLGERGIGADRVVELCPERERARVVRGDGLDEHLVHGGFRGGHIAVARKDAGVFDGCLGVALGGGGPQLG